MSQERSVEMIRVAYYFGRHDATRVNPSSTVPPELASIGVTSRKQAIECFRARVGDGRTEATFHGSLKGDILYFAEALRSGKKLNDSRVEALGELLGASDISLWSVVRTYLAPSLLPPATESDSTPPSVSVAHADQTDIVATPMKYWYFNTDETESPGRIAHERMIRESCIAAWGSCRELGAERLLQRPCEGDLVFLNRAGHGMVAMGRVTDEPPLASQSVFAEWGEYHRRLSDMRVLPKEEPLSAATIRNETGYSIPARHILCGIDNPDAARFLERYFDENAIPWSLPCEHPPFPSGGSGFGTPEENRLVEMAAINAVSKDYESKGWVVESVEAEKCGFDLKCRKNHLIANVEVKGVRGSEQYFMITANEVAQARTNPNFVLVVVTSALSEKRLLCSYSGHEFLGRFDLNAVQYRAALADDKV